MPNSNSQNTSNRPCFWEAAESARPALEAAAAAAGIVHLDAYLSRGFSKGSQVRPVQPSHKSKVSVLADSRGGNVTYINLRFGERHSVNVFAEYHKARREHALPTASVNRDRYAAREATRQAQAELDAQETARRRAYSGGLLAQYALAPPASPQHGYLRSKGFNAADIGRAGIRVLPCGTAVIPAFGVDGALCNLQRLVHRGGTWQKRFLPALPVADISLTFKGSALEGEVFFTTGVATARAVYAALGGRHSVVALFSDGGLTASIASYVKALGLREAHVVCDNDAFKPGAGNSGKRSGYQVAESLKPLGVKTSLYWPEMGLDEAAEQACLTSGKGPTDFDDLLQARGVEVVKTQLKTPRVRVTPKTGAESLQLSILQLEGRMGAQRRVEKLAVRAVATTHPHLASQDTLLSHLVRHRPKACSELEWQSWCEAVLERAIAWQSKRIARHHRIDEGKLAKLFPRVRIQRVADMAAVRQILETENEGLFFVSAKMGAGKTSGVMKPLVRQQERAGRQPVVVTASRNLSLNLSETLSIEDYESIKQWRARGEASSSICLQSFEDPRLKSLVQSSDALWIDEAPQTLYSLLGEHTQAPEAIRQTLAGAVNHARFTCLMSADLTADFISQTFELLELPRETAFTVFIDETQGEPIGKHVTQYQSKPQITEAIDACLASGGKPVIGCLTRADGYFYHKRLMQRYPGKHFLRIDSTTSQTPEAKAFLDNPTIEAARYDGIIHSPSITAGVSVELKNHFTDAFYIMGWAYGIGPIEATQMIGRFRDIKRVHAYYPPTLSVATEGAQDGVQEDSEALTAFRKSHNKEKAKMVADFGSVVATALQQKGYVLRYADTLPSKDRITRFNQDVKALRQARLEAVLEAPALSRAQRDALLERSRRGEVVFEHEHLQLERDVVCQYFHVQPDALTLEQLTMYQTDKARLDNLFDLWCPAPLAEQLNALEHTHSSRSRTFQRDRLAIPAIIGELLERLGLRLESSEHYLIDDKRVPGAFAFLMRERAAINAALRHGLGDVRAAIRKDYKAVHAIKLIRRVLKLAGIPLKFIGQRGSDKSRIRVYGIDAEQLAKFIKPVLRKLSHTCEQTVYELTSVLNRLDSIRLACKAVLKTQKAGKPKPEPPDKSP